MMNCLPFFKASVTWWIISSFAVVQKTKACLSGSEFETGSVSFMWVAACFMENWVTYRTEFMNLLVTKVKWMFGIYRLNEQIKLPWYLVDNAECVC